jgi:hypothetical protein
MIIKGVKLRHTSSESVSAWYELDIPEDLLRQLIREEIKLDKIGMTRLPDTPEERSCETCKYEKTRGDENPCHGCALWGHKHWEPKPTPHAPQDALARARRLSECSVKDEVIAYYESAIAEEQARTKLQREIGESRLEENRELRRRLEEAEARYTTTACDRNREIERREEAQRKLADAWTDELVEEYFAYRYGEILKGKYSMPPVGWLAERREERKV